MKRQQLQLMCIGMALLILGGCQGVERSLEISSQPSGALVHVNDVEVGRTPVSVPFTHYGTYDVRLSAQGYRPLWTQAKAKAPLWDLPGPDLVAEAVGGESVVDWHFELEPMPEQSEAELIENARDMRAMVGGEGGAAGDATADENPVAED